MILTNLKERSKREIEERESERGRERGGLLNKPEI